MKSLSAHAVRALIVARKKLVGQRVTLENQIRDLVVVFGVRLPRGLSPAFAGEVINGSGGVAGREGMGDDADVEARRQRGCPGDPQSGGCRYRSRRTSIRITSGLSRL